MVTFRQLFIGLGVLAVSGLAAPSFMAEAAPVQDWVRTETRDDCLDYEPLRKPLFGDTHVHTSYSIDARLFRLRSDPYDSYTFAKGGVQGLPPYDVLGDPQRTYQLHRPLDFLAVSDHAEGFGEMHICFDPAFNGYNSLSGICQDTRDFFDEPTFGFPETIPQLFVNWLFPLTQPNPTRNQWICGPGNADCTAAASLVWTDTQDAAEMHYDRSDACSFTTFNAYEWTGSLGQENIHRNIIYRNEDVSPLPTSVYEADLPEELFAALELDCLDAAAGNPLNDCDFISIPHNPNVSGGLMFSATRLDNGQPLSKADAEQRQRHEPIVELFQIKGNSECRLGISNDEDCRFETVNRLQNLGPYVPEAVYPRLNYIREGLKDGLSHKIRTGVNPFELGFIGSTDGHSNLPGAVNEEDYAFHGSVGEVDAIPVSRLANTQTNAMESTGGGLAVVYAEENSRDSIFAAMRRRETYATSGPRIGVRFFGGDLPENLCDDPNLVEIGYDNGAPMGGEIGGFDKKKAPSFVLMAQKDPGGGGDPSNQLQRAQIIKVWVDNKGEAHEEVIHVAGDTLEDSDAGLDTSTCMQTGSGYDSLCAVWTDPDFDQTENALYYGRVIETPVCRWHQYICNEEGIDPNCTDPDTVADEFDECCNPLFPDAISERAWTSPIYYIPESLFVPKGKLKIGKNGDDDSLKIRGTIGALDDAFDTNANDLIITIVAGSDLVNATFLAGTLEGDGRSFKYKSKTGDIGGIKQLKMQAKEGKVARIDLSTLKTDLPALPQDQDIEVTITNGDVTLVYSSQWEYDGKSSVKVPK